MPSVRKCSLHTISRVGVFISGHVFCSQKSLGTLNMEIPVIDLHVSLEGTDASLLSPTPKRLTHAYCIHETQPLPIPCLMMVCDVLIVQIVGWAWS